MGLKLDSQDVKNELEFKHSVNEELYGLELDDIQKILKQFNYHTKVIRLDEGWGNSPTKEETSDFKQ